MKNKIVVFFIIILIVILGVLLSYKKNNGSVKIINNPGTIVGGDRDIHGCIGSAGYSWCEIKNKCLRIWEEKCNASAITENEARVIAEKTCIKGGETLSIGYYNENSKTWWYDANLNSTQKGCNPACVVSEETKTAEINWRCTGLAQ